MANRATKSTVPHGYVLQTGDKFGKWTVLYKSYWDDHNHLTMIKCRCECGTLADVPRRNLIKGTSKGCVACHSAAFAGKGAAASKALAQKRKEAKEKAKVKKVGGQA